MLKTRWTKEDESFLINNYKTMFYLDIAKKINKTQRAVYLKARRMKLHPGSRARKGVMPSGDKNPNWRGGVSKDFYRYKKRMVKKYPEKNKARELLKVAVRNGTLIRPNKCEDCKKKKSKIYGHHEDYDKPLEVDWLCYDCHKKADALIKKLNSGL